MKKYKKYMKRINHNLGDGVFLVNHESYCGFFELSGWI
jgi:hypothetical protein